MLYSSLPLSLFLSVQSVLSVPGIWNEETFASSHKRHISRACETHTGYITYTDGSLLVQAHKRTYQRRFSAWWNDTSIMCSAGSYNSADGPARFAHLTTQHYFSYHYPLSLAMSSSSRFDRPFPSFAGPSFQLRIVNVLYVRCGNNGKTLAPSTSYEEIRTVFFPFATILMIHFIHFNKIYYISTKLHLKT